MSESSVKSMDLIAKIRANLEKLNELKAPAPTKPENRGINLEKVSNQKNYEEQNVERMDISGPAK